MELYVPLAQWKFYGCALHLQHKHSPIKNWFWDDCNYARNEMANHSNMLATCIGDAGDCPRCANFASQRPHANLLGLRSYLHGCPIWVWESCSYGSLQLQCHCDSSLVCESMQPHFVDAVKKLSGCIDDVQAMLQQPALYESDLRCSPLAARYCP
jgi:hypothetical protein